MDLFRVALALFTVFGVLAILYFVSRRAPAGTPRLLESARNACSGKFRLFPSQKNSAELEVLRRVNLTATHQLHLVRTAREVVLVCTHPQGCTLLEKHDALASADPQNATLDGLQRYGT